MDDGLKKLLSDGLLAIAIKIAGAGFTYAMFVVLARSMASGDYGEFAFGISLAITLSSVLSFGLPVAVLRFWPEYQVRGKLEVGRSFVARCGLFVLLASTCISLLAISIFNCMSPGLAGENGYLLAVAVLVPVLAMSEYVASSLRSLGTLVVSLAPRDVIWRIVVILVALAAGARFNAWEALMMAAVALLVIVAPQAVYAIRRMGLKWAHLRGEIDRSAWMAAALPNWGVSVVFALVQQFDVVVIGLYMAPELTGQYFAALRSASLQSLMLIGANMVAAPLISRYYHGGDIAGLKRMCRTLLIGIAGPALAGFALLVVFGERLLGLFNPAFISAYYTLVILASGFTLATLAGPIASFMQMVGREKDYLVVMATTYAAVISAQFLLVPVWGPLGAAIPNALGASICSGWAIFRLRATVGIDPSIIGLIWPVRDGNQTNETSA